MLGIPLLTTTKNDPSEVQIVYILFVLSELFSFPLAVFEYLLLKWLFHFAQRLGILYALIANFVSIMIFVLVMIPCAICPFWFIAGIAYLPTVLVEWFLWVKLTKRPKDEQLKLIWQLALVNLITFIGLGVVDLLVSNSN